MSSQTFHELTVWQRAHDMVLDVYELTSEFPKQEIYSLTSQLRRSAVSVPANIAEGYKKSGRQDKVRFFNIAQGSLEETRYYLLLARDLRYANTDAIQRRVDEVGRLLYSYAKAIRNG